MLIKNCRLIIDGTEQIKDILVENEKIVSIEDDLSEVSSHEIIDAAGNYVISGIIDPHEHMRDPGMTHKEDFTTGSMACAKGGITTFFDMPNTIPNTITEEALLEKKELHKGNSYVDYGFWFGGSKADNHEEVKKVQDKVIATKIFMNVSTGNMLVEDEKVLEDIFKNSKLVGVHAEGEMIPKAISLSEKTGVPVYLCHLSTKEDNEALWEGILDGTIDTIGTDHAPHRIEEKKAKLTFGIPGAENSLEMMLKAVRCDKISLEKLMKIMSENTAKIFGLKNKGKIAVGYDADLVIVDMTTEEIISQENVISKCGWTPYEGLKKGGKILTTIVRGNVVFNDGKFINKIGKEVI